MIIGLIRIEAIIYDAQSLKEKRSVIKSVADRIRRQYNVSFSEIDHQNVWQRAEWVALSVSGDRVIVERELQRVIDLLDRNEKLEVTKVDWEWL
ncbi:DUF503 domain-containing protein [Paenalkalicoccus suaedae]|uniref:DUF503 domain-containing protein n=1 Tax=Paenalkalicoccus suaedae TaxID=2592382 RepID=A0A859FFK9_9BACI|nr:DUF503 domain-containing protein [Paenalkalicoccus suaedae]QKS71394.1 DUF503 domain-containing protein [Paenalkalicoccus suaedae]